ncbi:hypothetical protein CANINC_004520 [Pichia inconspicua]|uniref:ABC transporter domain-containing protein n=1 Tax=Pichia inconspicua TaxID=52247 RepID=A0A4T0WVZ7_9ASCO|nr:hypothetical protein CANINC_004520 [[Candida] inconspicua]
MSATTVSAMSQLDAKSSNTYLLRTLGGISRFYKRRRNVVLKVSYIIIIYMLFNNGSKSKKSRHKGKNEGETASEIAVTEKQVASSFITKDVEKNPIKKFIKRIKRSATINLLAVQLNYKSKESLQSLYQLCGQIILLIVKAMVTLKFATLDGDLVSSLISRRFKKFFKFLSFWLLLGIPSSIVDSGIEYLKSGLHQSVRKNITFEILEKYLPKNGNSTIYQLINSNVGLNDPNHRLTTIVDNFAYSLSVLPSQLLTPILDILIAANHMSKTSDNVSEGALLLGLMANVSTLVLKIFTPNFSTLYNLRNSLENKFFEFHSNVILNNEEVALAKGHSKEIDLLDTCYFELEKFQRMALRRFSVYDFAVSFIFKYTLGAFGLLLCSVPAFTSVTLGETNEEQVTKLSSDFVTNRGLLLKASDSLGKLIQSKKNIQNMVGYANQIVEFEKILDEINESSKIEDTVNDRGEQPLLTGPNVSYGNEITFDKVPLITPKGNTLVHDLSFSIKQGDNLLIIGPNGCGKSSLFRILGGLWEVQSPGKLVVPHNRKDLFYLPQRSYFTYGSLREQIIYPDSLEEYKARIIEQRKGNKDEIIDDDYLVNLLHKVNLHYLLDYHSDSDSEQEDCLDTKTLTENCIFMEPSLDRVEKWPDFLSIGEQQRLAMVRLYYHKPKFAVLDECTSNISSDLESECYRIATKDLGITVISVCHRTTLWKFHNKILKFKKSNNENEHVTLFTNFNPELRLERHEELIKIDASLKRSDELNKRLTNLKKMKNSRSGRRPKLMYIEDT